MESYKEYLVFSVDYQTKIAFFSTEDPKNSFAVDINWDFPINNVKPKMFIENSENDEDNKTNSTKESSEKAVHNIAVNEKSSLLAFTCSDKSLFLCKIEESSIKVLSRRSFLRSSSCIRFSGNLLFLADKTGDIFEYSCDENNYDSPGKWIFGHISQILDLRLSLDSKYILTSDRDEKIRVTNVPAYHEIEMFCLGHKQFVSSLIVLTEDILLSLSGDGTLRLWNFLSGKQLNYTKLNFTPILFKHFARSKNEGTLCIVSTEFCVKIYDYQLIDQNAIKLHLLGEKKYSNDVEIAELKGNFYIEYIEDVEGHQKEIFIDKVTLNVDKKTAAFDIIKNIYANLNLSNDLIPKIFKSFNTKLLFKDTTRYDNVKQYIDRKKARIENQAMKKKEMK